jgi:hypothetical protein
MQITLTVQGLPISSLSPMVLQVTQQTITLATGINYNSLSEQNLAACQVAQGLAEDAQALAEAAALATAADLVQTGLDADATAADRVATGEDVVATAADRVQTGLDVVAADAALDEINELLATQRVGVAQIPFTPDGIADTFASITLFVGGYDVFYNEHVLARSTYTQATGSFTLPFVPEVGDRLTAWVWTSDYSVEAAPVTQPQAEAGTDESPFFWWSPLRIFQAVAAKVAAMLAGGELAHKASHATGQGDALTPADIGAATAGHNHSGTYDPAGTGAAAVSSHEGTYAHGDITHANRSALDLVSGTNTGDQDLSGYSPTSHNHTGTYEPLLTGATADAAPEDADTVYGGNSGSAFGTIKTTWTTIKAFLKTYFDTLYAANNDARLSDARNSKILAVQNTAVSVTGTTNQTTLFSYTLPAGTMGPNSVLSVTTLWNITNSGNSKALRVNFGGTLYYNIGLTVQPSVQHKVIIRNRNSQSSQIGFYNAANPYTAQTGTLSASAVNTAADVTILVTGQLTNPGETITLESVFIEVSNA